MGDRYLSTFSSIYLGFDSHQKRTFQKFSGEKKTCNSRSVNILMQCSFFWEKKSFYLHTITFILSLKIVTTSLHLQGSVNLLLTSMAAIDFLLLVCSILLFGIPSVSDYYTTAADFNILKYRLGPLLYTMALVFQTASVYLTVVITIERFVAVCYPFKAREFCTRGVNTTRFSPS